MMISTFMQLCQWEVFSLININININIDMVRSTLMQLCQRGFIASSASWIPRSYFLNSNSMIIFQQQTYFTKYDDGQLLVLAPHQSHKLHIVDIAVSIFIGNLKWSTLIVLQQLYDSLGRNLVSVFDSHIYIAFLTLYLSQKNWKKKTGIF